MKYILYFTFYVLALLAGVVYFGLNQELPLVEDEPLPEHFQMSTNHGAQKRMKIAEAKEAAELKAFQQWKAEQAAAKALAEAEKQKELKALTDVEDRRKKQSAAYPDKLRKRLFVFKDKATALSPDLLHNIVHQACEENGWEYPKEFMGEYVQFYNGLPQTVPKTVASK